MGVIVLHPQLTFYKPKEVKKYPSIVVKSRTIFVNNKKEVFLVLGFSEIAATCVVISIHKL